MSVKCVQSIHDLAGAADVPVRTVRRELSGPEALGEGARVRVMQTARGAGFARRGKLRPPLLAVVADRNTGSAPSRFVSSQVATLFDAISLNNAAVELVARHNLHRLRDHLIAGVIALGWDEPTAAALGKQSRVPVVAIDRLDVLSVSAVAWDHQAQARLVVEHLASRGHRRIAMLCDDRRNWSVIQQVNAFATAVKDAGLEWNGRSVVYADHQPIYSVLHGLMEAYKPTALYIASDDLLLEAMHILSHLLKLRIPHALSVVGRESVRQSQFLSPPITSVRQSMSELAEVAVKMVMSQVIEGQAEIRQVILPTEIIERESVAVAPNEH